MNMIKTMKEKAEKALARQKELLELCATESRDPTAEEAKEIDTAANTVERCFDEIGRLQKVEDASAKLAALNTAAKDATGLIARVTDTPAPYGQVAVKDLSPAEVIGLAAWASAANKMAPTKTAAQHLEDFTNKNGYSKINELCKRAAWEAGQEKSWTTGSGGDNAIFTPLSNDFIAYLYNQSAFLVGQPMIVDMPNGSLKFPKGNASAAGAYATEVADAGYSDATTTSVTMTAKHLKVITAISNYLIEVSPLAVASIVGQDLQSSLTVTLDSAGLRGTGSGANPSGIKTLVNAAHLVHSVAGASPKAPTVTEVEVDIKAMMVAMRATNIPWVRPRFMMSNRVFTYLQFMKTSQAVPQYAGLQDSSNPTWIDGIPVTRTEQIPNNQSDGTNSDCSDIYLTLFGHVMMGVTRQLRFETSREAMYVNSGDKSAFSRDETVIRGIASHDFGLRYDKAAYVLDRVRWGAP